MMARPTMTFEHGDRRRYDQGCRCDECKRARLLHTGTGGVADDELRVTCWCEMTIVPVPATEVRRGATRSCGAPHCNRLHDQNRKAS